MERERVKAKPVTRWQQRFWSYVDRRGPDECWNWTACKTVRGYGLYDTKAKLSKRVHRLSWLIQHGTVPADLFVCHSCDNRLCVNPKHLFLGTAADNAKDRDQKGRGAYSNFASRCKLTTAQVLEIRQIGKPALTMATRFGVTRRAIRSVLRRHTWADLEIRSERE